MRWNVMLVVFVVSICVISATEIKESKDGEEKNSEKGEEEGDESDKESKDGEEKNSEKGEVEGDESDKESKDGEEKNSEKGEEEGDESDKESKDGKEKNSEKGEVEGDESDKESKDGEKKNSEKGEEEGDESDIESKDGEEKNSEKGEEEGDESDKESNNGEGKNSEKGEEEGDESEKESKDGEEKNSKKGKKKGGTSDIKKAKKFMKKVNKIQLEKMHEKTLATFNHSTNLTDVNKEIKKKAGADLSKFMAMVRKKASKKFNWKSFKEKDPTLYRWFKMITGGKAIEDSSRKSPFTYRSGDLTDQMETIFQNAKMCPYNEPKKPCTLQLDPDLNSIMENSRNYEELKDYWKQFREQTGKKIRKLFIESVQENNKAAKKKGYKDFGVEQLSDYESKTITEDMAKVMKKIHPLYKQLHAYVRMKLRSYYKKNAITKDGPIPAHLLGDMYAQKWRGIYSIVDPYPKQSAPNVTKSMEKKKMKPIDMFILAEKFFVSIGLKKMTPHFWHYSMMEKPKDRQVECHGTAYDLHNNKDYRIKMCSTVNEEILETIHHEMGHIQYYMHYNNLPGPFQAAANPGFHEAIGDSMSLSVQTPDYLKKIGLLHKNETGDGKNYDISYLMRIALTFLSGVPYAYIIDHYRDKVYNGSIKDSELNKKYWEDRLKYQGVCPPVKRTEEDFDIGAKYHIPSNIEYLRYFFSNVFQFQIYKVLCKEAGHKGKLFKCNIYKNKKAGKKFADMLKAGASKPWQQTLSKFTGGKSKKLDPKPILEYFKPLLKWLKKENKNNHIGWKSKNPMECPES